MSDTKQQYINAITTQYDGLVLPDSISITRAMFSTEKRSANKASTQNWHK